MIGQAEGDGLLDSLGHGPWSTPETLSFWAELLGSKEVGMSMQDMEGYQELLQKLAAALPVEQRLAGLPAEQVLARYPAEQVLARYPAEQRLAGLPAEQRLTGLDREHQVLALSDEVLRGLSEDYIRSLSPGVQAEVRRRLQRR